MNFSKSIRDWQGDVHYTATQSGFHHKPACVTKATGGGVDCDSLQGEPTGVNTDRLLAMLALIHTEVSEAVEAARAGLYVLRHVNGKPEGVVTELADTVIRIMDTCEELGLDLEGAIEIKAEHNRKRSHMHGGKLA